MPKANDDHTTSPELSGDRGRTDAQQPETADPSISDWPLGDIEPALADLRSTAAMLGHMATSEKEATTEDLHYLQGQIIAAHRRIEAFWSQAFDQQGRDCKMRAAERAAHKAALTAAEARAAPGSQAAAESVAACWSLLASVAKVMREQAERAIPGGTGSPVGDAIKLRHVVAPIDAGLPPAEGRA